VTGIQDTPPGGYKVVRCMDDAVVARFKNFPVCERALMYRKGDEVSFVPLRDDEIVGTPSLMTQILERAGYRVSISDILT